MNGDGHIYLITFMTVCKYVFVASLANIYAAELRENGLVTYCIVPNVGRLRKYWRLFIDSPT